MVSLLSLLAINQSLAAGKYNAVLDIGDVPDIARDDWELQVDGLVENPVTLRWDDLLALPQVEDVSDFHCVTTWSRFDNRWKGVRFRDLAKLVIPRDEARFVTTEGYDKLPGSSVPYTTNLPVARATEDDVMLVHTGKANFSPGNTAARCA